MLWPLNRRPKTPAPRRGPAIQQAEQEKAKALLLALARRRQAAHVYDGPTR